jgi:hypothetical protein
MMAIDQRTRCLNSQAQRGIEHRLHFRKSHASRDRDQSGARGAARVIENPALKGESDVR